MEYTVIRSNDALRLSLKVIEGIDKGWLPLGGVSVATLASVGGVQVIYCQAMTKVPPPKPPKKYHSLLTKIIDPTVNGEPDMNDLQKDVDVSLSNPYNEALLR